MIKTEIKSMLTEFKNYLESHGDDEYLLVQNHSSINDDLLDTEIDYELSLDMINYLLQLL